MLTIAEYLKPQSVAEAYQLLTSRENSVIIGGGFFTRLGSKKIGVAIDLSEAKLDGIRETDTDIEIGGMVSFSQLQKSPLLQQNFSGVVPSTVSHLPGEQMRNMVSVGGTICGKYGFSELLTTLMVLNCRVVLHHRGTVSLADFLQMKSNRDDILEKLLIKKENRKAAYQMFRQSSGSLPILCVAASQWDDRFIIAVGGRPALAAPAENAMQYLSSSDKTEASVIKAAEMAAAELQFSNDRRASAEYRQDLCQVLVKRAVKEVLAQ